MQDFVHQQYDWLWNAGLGLRAQGLYTHTPRFLRQTLLAKKIKP